MGRREEAINMNQPVPDDLISAYFDGEVTSDERKRVERLLKTSSESRQLLDDTSKLSALLHSFPREAAPANLALNVKAQIDAKTPLAPVPPVVTRRGFYREWGAFAAGIAVTAASLFLFVAFDASRKMGAPSAIEVASSPARDSFGLSSSKGSKPASELAFAPLADHGVHSDSLDAVEHKGESLNVPVDAVRNEDATKTAIAGNSNPPNVAAASPVPAGAVPIPAATASAPIMAQTSPVKEQLDSMVAAVRDSYNEFIPLPQQSDDFLRSLKQGDVVYQYVANPNNTVMIVEMTVVDIDKGAEMLEMVLERVLNRDKGADEAQKLRNNSVSESPAKDSAKNNVSADNLVVMFVRAPGERLADALSESTKHPEVYRAISPQLPMEIATTAVKSSGGLASATNEKASGPVPASSGNEQPAEQQTVASEANLVVNSFANRNGLEVDEKSMGIWSFKQNQEKIAREFGAHGRMGANAATAKVAEPEASPSPRNRALLNTLDQQPIKNRQELDQQSQGFAAFRVAANKRSIASQQQAPSQPGLFNYQQQLQSRPFGINSNVEHQQSNQRILAAEQSPENRDVRMMRLLIVLKSEQLDTPAE